MLRVTRCSNCNELPLVQATAGTYWAKDYAWMLSHEVSTCPSTYHLFVLHDTRDQCVEMWNEFNTDRDLWLSKCGRST